MMSKWTLMAAILIAATMALISGCTADGSFSADEIGPALQEAGEQIVDTADAFDESLSNTPSIDNTVGPEMRRGSGAIRLFGEGVLLLSTLFLYRKNREKQSVLDEVDENPKTPSVEEQVKTRKVKRLARKAV